MESRSLGDQRNSAGPVRWRPCHRICLLRSSARSACFDLRVALRSQSHFSATTFILGRVDDAINQLVCIPTHGYEPTREAAMAAFAKTWRREQCS